MSDDDRTQANIQTPLGSVNFNGKKTAEFISILSLCALMLLGYVLWEHTVDVNSNAQEFKQYLRANVEAQREMNCLLSLPQEKRYEEYRSPSSFCKTISRER